MPSLRGLVAQRRAGPPSATPEACARCSLFLQRVAGACNSSLADKRTGGRVDQMLGILIFGKAGQHVRQIFIHNAGRVINVEIAIGLALNLSLLLRDLLLGLR